MIERGVVRGLGQAAFAKRQFRPSAKFGNPLLEVDGSAGRCFRRWRGRARSAWGLPPRGEPNEARNDRERERRCGGYPGGGGCLLAAARGTVSS
jgi:hypothetical protein